MAEARQCAECSGACDLIYYPSAEEMGHPVNWGPGWRTLYFNLEHDVDFCGADCYLAWHEDTRDELD